MNFFKSTAAPRLKELADMVKKYGKPWYTNTGSKTGKFEAVAEGWYPKY